MKRAKIRNNLVDTFPVYDYMTFKVRLKKIISKISQCTDPIVNKYRKIKNKNTFKKYPFLFPFLYYYRQNISDAVDIKDPIKSQDYLDDATNEEKSLFDYSLYYSFPKGWRKTFVPKLLDDISKEIKTSNPENYVDYCFGRILEETTGLLDITDNANDIDEFNDFKLVPIKQYYRKFSKVICPICGKITKFMINSTNANKLDYCKENPLAIVNFKYGYWCKNHFEKENNIKLKNLSKNDIDKLTIYIDDDCGENQLLDDSFDFGKYWKKRRFNNEQI